jgi:hypothetical protein
MGSPSRELRRVPGRKDAMPRATSAVSFVVRASSHHYVDKGAVATIGRSAAVAEIGGLTLLGFVAWTAWLGVHLFYLMGFRRRFIVMAEWAWLYLRNEHGARLITGDVESLLGRGRREPLPAGRATSSQKETREGLAP